MVRDEIVQSISRRFEEIGLGLESVESVPPVLNPQVMNLDLMFAVQCTTASELLTTHFFEIHLGRLEEKVSAFLGCRNGVEHSWVTYDYATSHTEAINEVIGRIFSRFVKPILLESSIPKTAFKELELTPLPRSLVGRVDSSLGERLIVFDRSTGIVRGAYMFREHKLFRSFQDELFHSSLMHFEPVETHNFSEKEMMSISPAEWVVLLQAWIAKDVFYNFPHLESNDFDFAQFGKQVRQLRRRLPWRFQSSNNSGVASWITRHDVASRVNSREKWYPEDWQSEKNPEG